MVSLTGILDPLNNAASFYHDSQGNLTNITFPDATSLTYQYDSAERVASVSDGAGRSLPLGYDNQGLVTTVSNAYGQVWGVSYDIRDRQAITTDANGVTVTNTYDPLDRILTRTWADGIGEGFGYSQQGLAFYTNRDNQITHYGRDVAGRLITVTNANTEVVQLGYDPASDITNLIDGLTHPTTWQYNQFGWLTNKMDTLGSNAFEFAYNADGWVTNRVTPQMGATAYTYDNVGNLKSIVYPLSTINYLYDADNRLTNMVDAVGTNTFSYTQVGQLASENGPWANDTVSYLYSQMLRTNLTLTQPSGSWVQGYGYDNAWRMTNIASTAGAFSYAFGGMSAASSLIKQISLPNGAFITNTYDSMARLLSTALENSSNSNLDSYAYGYDQAGQRTNVTRTFGDFVNYTYDNEGELKTAFGKEAGGTTNRWQEQFGYAYDAAGNLNYPDEQCSLADFQRQQFKRIDHCNQQRPADGGRHHHQPSNKCDRQYLQCGAVCRQHFCQHQPASGQRNQYLHCRCQGQLWANKHQQCHGLSAGHEQLLLRLNGNLTNDGSRNFAYDDENQLTSVCVTNVWSNNFVYDGKMRSAELNGITVGSVVLGQKPTKFTSFTTATW